MAKPATGRSATIGSAGQLDLLSGSAKAPEPASTDGELERLQQATADGLGSLDHHTLGRLRELIEHAGDEFAALIDLVLDNREASA